QLVSPSVDPDGVGSPEAADHDFLGIISNISDEAIQSQSAAKMDHRTNSRPSVWHPRDPTRRQPETDRGSKCRTDRHRYQGPVPVASFGPANADCRTHNQGDHAYHR